MSRVTVAQVTMQTWDWARDCTILLHTKTHATVLEDSVHILTYQSTLNYPTDKCLFYFSTISAIAKITIIATILLSSNMVSFSLLYYVMMSYASGLVCCMNKDVSLQTQPLWPMQQHAVRADSRHGLIVLYFQVLQTTPYYAFASS